jgi:ABC-type multidrug transport system ATPase subunit
MGVTPEPRVETWTIRLEGLTKIYSGNVLFQDLDLQIRPGMAIHVQGPNGSGKTQLMLLIAGLVEPDAGRICLCGRTKVILNRLDPETRARFVRYVPYLLGGLAEMPIDRALLVITRHLRPFGLNSQSIAAAKAVMTLDSELRLICDENIEMDRPLANYSIGQQKRIVVAASMTVKPFPFLVMVDEPLAGLDAGGVERVLDLLRAAREHGIALLVSEHRPEIAGLKFDQVLRLPYRPHGGSDDLVSTTDQSQMEAERDQAAKPVLRLTDVTSGYVNCPVYCSSLTVSPGELVVIQGNNGSGKTGFIRGLFRHLGTTLSGRLEIDGVRIPDLRLAQQTSFVRYLSQVRDVFPDLTVQESVAVTSRGHKTDLFEEIADIVRFLGPRKLVRHLSSGGLALLGLAQALSGGPSLLILDEPAANTDALNRQRVWDLVGGARRRARTAVLVIEHDPIPGMTSAVYRLERQQFAVLRRIA